MSDLLIYDIDNDSNNEIITGGYTQNKSYMNAELYIWNYSAGKEKGNAL